MHNEKEDFVVVFLKLFNLLEFFNYLTKVFLFFNLLPKSY